MIFFLLLSLFIVPYCYGAANSFSNQADEIFLFLPADKECAQLINAFETVKEMPTLTKDNKVLSFSSPLINDFTRETALKQDFNNRLNQLSASMYKLSMLVQKLDEFKDGKFFCIKVKPIDKKIVPIPRDEEAYKKLLAFHIQVISVTDVPDIVKDPSTELDFVKNYFAQRFLIAQYDERSQKHSDDLEKEKQSFLNEQNSKKQLEKKILRITKEKKDLSGQIELKNIEYANRINALNEEIVVLKRDAMDKIGEITAVLNCRVESKNEYESNLQKLDQERIQLQKKISDNAQKIAELQGVFGKLQVFKQKNNTLSNEITEFKRMCQVKDDEKKAILDTQETEKEKFKETIEEQEKKITELNLSIVKHKDELALVEELNKSLTVNLSKRSVLPADLLKEDSKHVEDLRNKDVLHKVEITSLNDEINRNKENNKVRMGFAVLFTFFVWPSLLGFLVYHPQALKNIDVQSCLKWVKESGLRFSDFVQLQYLVLQAQFRA